MRSVYERKIADDEMRKAFKCFDIDNSGKTISIKNVFFNIFFS